MAFELGNNSDNRDQVLENRKIYLEIFQLGISGEKYFLSEKVLEIAVNLTFSPII